MTRPTRLEINCETGEQIVVEMTDEEIEQLEIDRAHWEAQQATAQAAEEAKAAAKASALAKLAALGLTAEEAAAIAG